MRTPEHRQRAAPPRAGKKFEVDLDLHYLSPGAFTILPRNESPPPDPPSAPNPYRLQTTNRRHKNQSFAVIGEVQTSRPGSPSGRVSPFRGHGFNPTGSRHASPAPSPPPEDVRLSPRVLSPKQQSRIPKYTNGNHDGKRRGSQAAMFGEKVSHIQSPSSSRRKTLQHQFSQSLNDLEVVKKSRPPISPRKRYGKTPAFQRLSPIIGSSPEPSQSQSSPTHSRIPKSRSHPASRITSPTRYDTFGAQDKFSRNVNQTTPRTKDAARKNINAKLVVNENNSVPNKPPIKGGRSTPRATSRNTHRGPASRNQSREPSPQKVTSPTRIPTKKYKNIPAKVNSFKLNSKPKVPSNNNKNVNVSTTEFSDSDATITAKPKPSVARSKVDSSNKPLNRSNNLNKKNVKNSDANNRKADPISDNTTSNFDLTTTTSEDERLVDLPITSSSINSTLPSATTMVSSTTTTATKPLKIDAKIDPATNQSKAAGAVIYDRPKAVSPMVDDSQTIMKESGLSRLSPAAKSVISMANNGDQKEANDQKTNESKPSEVNQTKDQFKALKDLDLDKQPKLLDLTLNQMPAATGVDLSAAKTNHANPMKNHNHVSHGVVVDSPHIYESNMKKLITPGADHPLGNSIIGNSVANEHAKPIRILVREKPSEIEVQSGNVRLPASATNGINDIRPDLPPSSNNDIHNSSQESNGETAEKTNGCTKFFKLCGSKLSCKNCKKQTTDDKTSKSKSSVEESTSTGCFKCCSRKPKPDQVRINIEDEDNASKNCCGGFLDRLKCCGKNKIRDSSCFSGSGGSREASWRERRDSILGSPPPQDGKKCSKQCCKDFWYKLFCLHLCCKKKPEPPPPEVSRKTSVISKKKSLTPTSVPPPEDTRPKIDISLVEHTSHMRGAIPVLPVYLAWFCLVMNCIAPGTGTVFSGLFCLCIGKPRFSQKDGYRQRIGAFIIDLIIGFGQFFTVLFCLVGWGWSIWWGVIMLKVARKHRKLKQLEAIDMENTRPPPVAHQTGQQQSRRGSQRRS